jgi:DedD protein
VLLLLVALLVFLYRYTDLIKPRYNAVGMYHPSNYRPLPEQGGKPAAVVNPEGQQPVTTETGNNVPAPQIKPALAPTATQASTVLLSPATIPKLEVNPVQKEQATPPAPATSAKPQVKAEALPAAVAASGGNEAPKTVKAIRKAAQPGLKGGAYTLLIGEFAGGQDMASIRARLKKLGITPIHEKQVKRLDPMHRLFLANFDSHQVADTELQKLRHQTTGAFIALEKGKYAVYAGSYLNEKRAVAEQQRLAGNNVKLSRQTALVTVSLTRLTAGSFSGSTPAHKEAARLQKQGVIARVIKAGS